MLFPHGTRASDLIIQNARVIDGTGAPPREDVEILIRNGQIDQISTHLSVGGIPTLDVAGATVLPGLIDAHVHFAAAPGGGFRDDSAQTRRELNREHLRAYLANGVTTVFEPGSPIEAVREVQDLLAEGASGPRYLTTGPMVRVPGGFGAEGGGTVHTPEDVEAVLDLIESIGGVGVKLTTEQGFNPFGSLPTYSPEIQRAIVEGATRRGLPVYVHAMSERDAELALDLGAHAIMHSPAGGVWTGQFFGTDDLSEEFVARMVGSGAYQLTTFSILDTWPGAYDAKRLDDPLVRLTVPEVERDTARDPSAVRFFYVSMLGFAVPWTFEFARPWLAQRLWSPENLREGLRYSQRNVRRLHLVGVPIVAATDAPSLWPFAIYHFHGPQTAREVELLGEAGLAPIEAIVAATRTPSRMLGLEDEIGTVEVGKSADLLIVGGDPLQDLGALRRVRWVVRAGTARTPEQWMNE
jgi:imidazolonepropionase-like amidohydrolase